MNGMMRSFLRVDVLTATLSPLLGTCISIKITPADTDTAQINTRKHILKNGPLFHVGGY